MARESQLPKCFDDMTPGCLIARLIRTTFPITRPSKRRLGRPAIFFDSAGHHHGGEAAAAGGEAGQQVARARAHHGGERGQQGDPRGHLQCGPGNRGG
eukprot:4146995-Pyramimonas_sp.AAC.1